ncbi:MAG: response regulator [Spirochaetes bacterium]|nr:response regulator [Spirochaetota bacterium]
MLKILLVDDNKYVIEDIGGALESMGHYCIGEVNPLHGLELYKKGDFDVVIVDVKMPGMNGIEFLKEVQQFNPNAAVIILTSYGDSETYKEAMNNRAYAFFSKPSMDIRELMECLAKIEHA